MLSCTNSVNFTRRSFILGEFFFQAYLTLKLTRGPEKKAFSTLKAEICGTSVRDATAWVEISCQCPFTGTIIIIQQKYPACVVASVPAGTETGAAAGTHAAVVV